MNRLALFPLLAVALVGCAGMSFDNLQQGGPPGGAGAPAAAAGAHHGKAKASPDGDAAHPDAPSGDKGLTGDPGKDIGGGMGTAAYCTKMVTCMATVSMTVCLAGVDKGCMDGFHMGNHAGDEAACKAQIQDLPNKVKKFGKVPGYKVPADCRP